MRAKGSSRSPKQPQPEHRRDWYPYYAGFTVDFVDAVLATHGDGVRTVLDPWNGAGTTTSVCARRKLDSAGVDLNPALTVIARARLTPVSVAESLTPLAAEILDAAQRRGAPLHPNDPLGTWLRAPAVERLRAIQGAIHAVLSDVPDRSGLAIDVLAGKLPLLAAFYYSALFATTRDTLSRFRATNPAWIRTPDTERHRINPGWPALSSRFLLRVQYLASRLSVPNSSGSTIELRTASATDLPFESNSFDATITSPPYATRIDYIKGVLPELSVLGATAADVEQLRRSSTGSPVVRGVPRSGGRLESEYGLSLLEGIKGHDSKGSRSYYYPWMSNYLHGLQSGLNETARVVVAGGPICIVAQDSHYKELHIDLQRVIVDMMRAAGRQLVNREDYDVRHHMARINPRARRYVENPRSQESLLVFR